MNFLILIICRKAYKIFAVKSNMYQDLKNAQHFLRSKSLYLEIMRSRNWKFNEGGSRWRQADGSQSCKSCNCLLAPVSVVTGICVCICVKNKYEHKKTRWDGRQCCFGDWWTFGSSLNMISTFLGLTFIQISHFSQQLMLRKLATFVGALKLHFCQLQSLQSPSQPTFKKGPNMPN